MVAHTSIAPDAKRGGRDSRRACLVSVQDLAVNVSGRGPAEIFQLLRKLSCGGGGSGRQRTVSQGAEAVPTLFSAEEPFVPVVD